MNMWPTGTVLLWVAIISAPANFSQAFNNDRTQRTRLWTVPLRKALSAEREVSINGERKIDHWLALPLFTFYHLPFSLFFAMRHALCSMRSDPALRIRLSIFHILLHVGTHFAVMEVLSK